MSRKISSLTKTQAVCIDLTGEVSDVSVGDTVVVCVVCWIDKDGNPIPVNEEIQSIRNDISRNIGKHVFIAKRKQK